MSTVLSDRNIARLLLGLALFGGLSCTFDRHDAATLARVHIQANGVILPGDALPVRYQPFDDPQLERLATREHLRTLGAGIPRQFDQIKRVQDWVNAQWPDGTPSPYPPWNALTVLDWIRAGTTGGFCAQYAQVFLQSLAALGFTARYIEIGSRENPFAHYLTEVWSNDFNKWVVLDPDFNIHFERQGVPLSALEVHDALVSSPSMADVQPVFTPSRPRHASPLSWPLRTAELYYYLRYHLNANHLSRPDDPPFERFEDMVEFDDPKVTAWEVSTVPTTFPRTRLTRRRTGDRRVVSAPLNQVQVGVRSTDTHSVTLELRDNVLQRATYEYRVNATGAVPAPWQSIGVPAITLRIPDTGALVEVRGVNIRGIAGAISTLAIDPLVPPVEP